MGKTSRRGELEDREAGEEDLGFWGSRTKKKKKKKNGTNFRSKFHNYPRNYLHFFFFKFHFEVSLFLTFNDCQLFFLFFFPSVVLPPSKLQLEWPEVFKVLPWPFFVSHHYLVFEEDTKVTYKKHLEGSLSCLSCSTLFPPL